MSHLARDADFFSSRRGWGFTDTTAAVCAGSGFSTWFRVDDSLSNVYCLLFMADGYGLWFMVYGLWFKVQSLGF